MSKIIIVKTGITDITADAIVNAANEGLYAGSGVCGYIFEAAGYEELTAACRKIGHCDTGSAVITPGFHAKAKYIIHAVGPIWNGGQSGEPRQLYSCYLKSLELAKEKGCRSIAFPLISAGIFGYPKEKAWRKAIQACRDFIGKNPDYDLTIYFTILDDKILRLGNSVLEELAPAASSAFHGSYSATREKLVEVFRDTQTMLENHPVLKAQTEDMCAGSRFYPAGFQAAQRTVKNASPHVEVVANTTLNCASGFAKSGKHVAVLNFASAYRPGGGATTGARAQEESLCRSSSLYPGLVMPKMKKQYYSANKLSSNDEGFDSLLYHPGVAVFKDDSAIPRLMPEDEWFRTDVITCAAPHSRRENPISDKRLYELHLSRGQNILEAAIDNGVDVLVLGAFGCGVFNNPPKVVAGAFRALLLDRGYAKYFDRVVFAIKKDRNDRSGNFAAFQAVFDVH